MVDADFAFTAFFCFAFGLAVRGGSPAAGEGAGAGVVAGLGAGLGTATDSAGGGGSCGGGGDTSGRHCAGGFCIVLESSYFFRFAGASSIVSSSSSELTAAASAGKLSAIPCFAAAASYLRAASISRSNSPNVFTPTRLITIFDCHFFSVSSHSTPLNEDEGEVEEEADDDAADESFDVEADDDADGNSSVSEVSGKFKGLPYCFATSS